MMEIKDELTRRLDAAKGRYEAAREEVELLDALLEKFNEHTRDNTRAFRAVPPASGPIQNAPQRPAEVFPPAAVISCSRCGEQLTQHGNSWVDGTGFGTCGEDNVRHHAVSSNGGRVDQQPTSVRLPAEMVPPRPDEGECEGCRDWAGSPQGCPVHGHDNAHPAADLSATRPDEPQGSAS